MSPLEFEHLWHSGVLTQDHIKAAIAAGNEFFKQIVDGLSGKGGSANVSSPPSFAMPDSSELLAQIKWQEKHEH